MPDATFGERVCVFVELRPGHELTLDDLRAHLERAAPARSSGPNASWCSTRSRVPRAARSPRATCARSRGAIPPAEGVGGGWRTTRVRSRELFDAEYAGLVRLATLITGDVAAAEDAVQEAFARAIRDWLRLRSYDRPGAWVWRVTIRLAVRDRGRRRRERAERPPRPRRSSMPRHPTPSSSTAARAPPNQRAALVLFYFERLTTAEVADGARRQAEHPRSLLHRGRAASHSPSRSRR